MTRYRFTTIFNLEEMKTLMRAVFVPIDYTIDLYRKYRAWKINSTMTESKYLEGFRKMNTHLHSSEGGEVKVHRYITGISQAIEDEIYEFCYSA